MMSSKLLVPNFFCCLGDEERSEQAKLWFGDFPPLFCVGQKCLFLAGIGVQEGILRTLLPLFRVAFFPEGFRSFGTELVTAAALFDPTISFSGLPHPTQCRRPWHYGGKHSSLNVAICQIANRLCKIRLEVETVSLNLKRFEIQVYVLRCTTYHSDIPTWISHHLGSVGYLEYIKIPPEESVYRYEIAWIGIKDVSNPMPILYVDHSTGCGLFPSCPCVPTPHMHPDIRDCVESYTIHMIFARRLRITFNSLSAMDSHDRPLKN